MAAKKSAKKSPQRGKGVAVSVQTLQVGGDWTKDYYFNHINVSHTPWDFSLSFGLLKMPQRVKAPKGALVIEVKTDIEIKFPVNLLPGLIQALERQRERYEQTFGPIIEPAEEHGKT